MRDIKRRYASGGDNEQRRKRLVELLSAGLERLLRKRGAGLDSPGDVWPYTHGRPDGRQEDEPWS